MNLYITADQIGTPTGGGAVTYHESEALNQLAGGAAIWDRTTLTPLLKGDDPWCWDNAAKAVIEENCQVIGDDYPHPTLVHFYAGTFTETIKAIRKHWPKAKITYTAAAHNIEESKRAFEGLGIPFNFPHLTDPKLWKHYVGGYLAADLVICPSQHSAECMRSYGAKNIAVIPHGCNLPDKVTAPPKQFRVGYLGAYGPDKGVHYLLQAWRKLKYSDAVLVLGGRDSISSWADHLIHCFYAEDPSRIERVGWVDNISDFYNNISLYVQPSVTEGFGIEVLEAMAHNRPVICSKGAGACDLVPDRYCPAPRNVDALADLIETVKRDFCIMQRGYPWPEWRDISRQYTWDKIRARYIKTWNELLDPDGVNKLMRQTFDHWED